MCSQASIIATAHKTMIQVSFDRQQTDIKSLTKFVPALKMALMIFSFGKGLTG